MGCERFDLVCRLREFTISREDDAVGYLAGKSHFMVTMIMVMPCSANSFATFNTSPTISGQGEVGSSKEHNIWIHGESTGMATRCLTTGKEAVLDGIGFICETNFFQQFHPDF